MSIPRSVTLINKAQEEETREALFRLYLADRPNMTEKTAMTFNQYYDKHKPKNIILDNRSDEEIMAEILAIK